MFNVISLSVVNGQFVGLEQNDSYDLLKDVLKVDIVHKDNLYKVIDMCEYVELHTCSPIDYFKTCLDSYGDMKEQIVKDADKFYVGHNNDMECEWPCMVQIKCDNGDFVFVVIYDEQESLTV